MREKEYSAEASTGARAQLATILNARPHTLDSLHHDSDEDATHRRSMTDPAAVPAKGQIGVLQKRSASVRAKMMPLHCNTSDIVRNETPP